MATPRYKFVLTVGEDSEKIFQWKDSRKVPIDITGYKIECNLFSDANAVFATLSTENGKIITDPSKGKFTIIFDNDLTEVKLTSYAKYEVWFTTPNYKKKLFLTGALSFVKP